MASFKLLLAIAAAMWLCALAYIYFKPTACDQPTAPTTENGVVGRKNLLIGVLTAEKYLLTRAIAIHKTWGQDLGLSSQLFFFVGEDCNTDHHSLRDLPIIKLRGVKDDVYPPQEKAFALWHYLNQHHVNQFKWFLRADDDLYVRVSKLEAALQRLDWREQLEIGHPGYGLEEDRKRLKLLPGENYCMGGPGVILSAPALGAVSKFLGWCQEAVREYNKDKDRERGWYNEDVELGRCISRTLGISCSPLTEVSFGTLTWAGPIYSKVVSSSSTTSSILCTYY